MFQPSLSDLGQPLADATFVVVDLETTGGSPRHDRITEIGAVKLRTGELLGELSTGVTVLTGISDGLVEGRPRIAAVLPSFLEFSRGAVLVAHNARFDVGFLNAALERLDYPRLAQPVVCTAQLARRLVGDEVANRRLGSLAHLFRASTVPVHRALADARATVDVFHALLERAGTFGVVTVEDLVSFSRVANMPVFASRRKMADGLPRKPGVYRFVSASGEVLYVGKATDLRGRVRQYFGGDTRPRMARLVKESSRIDHTVTPTVVEAEIREARLIRQHRPRFNRRGKRVRAPVWVTLTTGAYPRLSIARTPPKPGRMALGPLPSRHVAQSIIDAIHEALPLRRCTTAMKADTRFSACALAEMGRCLAPCTGAVDPEGYAITADEAAAVLDGRITTVVDVLAQRMTARADAGRYEEARVARDRIALLGDWVVRTRRDLALRNAGLLVASRPAGEDRREVLIQRAGWLVATAACSPAEIPELLDATTPDVPDDPAPPEELAILQRWLAGPDVRLEHCEDGLAWPVAGAAHTAAGQQQLAAATTRVVGP